MDGVISHLHLPNNRFEFGNEMLPDQIEKAKKIKKWDKYSNDDLQNAKSYSDFSVSNIVMIHVFDHIQNIDAFFSEINRIQELEGKIFFSGLSSDHIKYSLKYQIQNILRLANFEKYSKYLGKSFNQYKFATEDCLKRTLNGYGYRLIDFYYFNGGSGFDKYFLIFFTMSFINTNLKNHSYFNEIIPNN